MRPSLKCLVAVVVVAAVTSWTVPQADAHLWGCRSVGWGCCYTPCYTPCYTAVACYTPCYTPCYSSCYGGWYGGYRSCAPRRAAYRCCWGGYYSAWDSCCTSYDSCCGGGTVISGAAPAAPALEPTPAQKPIAEPAMPSEPTPPAPPAPADSAAPSPADPVAPGGSANSAEQSGILTVWVPHDAKVTVNGLDTRSKGSRRQFVSFGLQPGLSYKYVVKAQVVRNGQTQEDTRTVVLTAGQTSSVAFGFNISVEQVASAR